MTRIVAKGALSTTVSKSTLQALMTDVTPTSAKVFRFDGTTVYYQKVTNQGSKTYEGGLRQKFVPGQLYTQAQIDAVYPAATLTSVTPAAASASGGTTQTFKGSNLGGTSGITLGGTAYTSVTVVDDNTVTAVSPAKTAGTYNVVLTDDSGATPTLTNAVTTS